MTLKMLETGEITMAPIQNDWMDTREDKVL